MMFTKYKKGNIYIFVLVVNSEYTDMTFENKYIIACLEIPRKHLFI